MPTQPVYVVFAGVNGAGKSTFYHSSLWFENKADAQMLRVNPDEILVEAGRDWASPADQMWAAKRALFEVRHNFDRRRSFSQETTLAGHSSVARIRRARELGYRVRLFYIGVDSSRIALERIANRTKFGGHDIAEEAVARRFEASVLALGKALDYTHEAFVYDNSNDFACLAVWRDATLCWWSVENAKAHPWLGNAMRQNGWRA